MRVDDSALPPLPAPAPLKLDLAKYRTLLSEYALTDGQADALLREVGGLMGRCGEAGVAIPSIPDIFAVLLTENSETDSVPVDSSAEPNGQPQKQEPTNDGREGSDDH